MKPGRGKDLVAAAALATALLLGSFWTLRSGGFFGVTWSDGVRRFASETGDSVRHAVWDVPEELASLGEASDPTVSADGRWLVFVCGERGLNSELYLAEIVDGVPRDPRPLEEVNSPADELSPAFGPGRMIFASDREGGVGGLDLWSVPFEEGRFGSPEPLPPGVNSTADELDPALAPGTDELVFASDRAGGDLDLYLARPDSGGVWIPAALELVNSTADEREPSFGRDPRQLFFASDRAGGAGGFDLFRALRFADGWHAPDPVHELVSARSERGPWPASDGFELWFATQDDAGASTLWRARSRELLRLPSAAITLAQWLTLAALVVLALLALLAKRWRALDILYRCLLVSLLLHLLLMLYLRAVAPEERTYETAPDDGPSFRVELAPPEPTAAGSGLAGASAPARAHLVPTPTPAEAPRPALASLAASESRPDPSMEAAPGPRGIDAPNPASPAPALAVPAEEAPHFEGTRPALALDAGSAAPERAAPAQPHRDTSAATAGPVARPRAATLEAGEASVADLQNVPAPPRTAAAPGVSPTKSRAAPALAQPHESFERAAGTAPALALDAPPGETARPSPRAPARAAGGASPSETSQPWSPAGRVAADPVATGLESAPPRELLAAGGELAGTRGEAATALREPAPDSAPEATASSRFAATEGLEPPRLAEAPREPAGPTRSTTNGGELARTEPAAGTTTDLLPGPVASLDASSPEPSRSRASPVLGRREVEPPLRGPRAEPSAPPRVESPVFAATSGLARGEEARQARDVPAAPRRVPAPETTSALPAIPGEARLSDSGPTEVRAAPAPARVQPMEVEGNAPRPELRSPVPPHASTDGGELATRAPTFEATAGLEAPALPARSRPTGPERVAAAASDLAPVRPEPTHLEAPPVTATPEDLPDRAAPPRLSETPYQNRFGEQKLRALAEFGGTRETEKAVAAGLAYLAGIQGDDGAWGERSDRHSKYQDVRIGKSALALLAFLGAGHVPGGDTEHAAVAERAVRFLLGAQDRRSGHFGRSCCYGHGIATYALAECYALTREEDLRQPLERAVAQILRNQQEGDDPRFAGGWGYYFSDGHVWNGDQWPRTSVTAWQVMALESARLGGLSVPDGTFGAARDFLLHMWDPRARAFLYDHDPQRLSSGYPILPASTPAALFALSLLGVDPGHEELAAARRFVLTRMPDGYRYTGDDDFVRSARGNLYFWYYATLAMFRVGGDAWAGWNAALKETLLPAQEDDGSWRPLDVYAEYAGDEDDERTYTTSLCVLSLEIYYRYFTPLLRVR